MEVLNRLDGGVTCDGVASPRIFRSRLEEIEVALENILDAEEVIPESGALHQGCQRLAMLRKRRRHPLYEVLDVVEAGVDNRLAQQSEAAYVERDVVVDQEDGPGAVASRIGDVGDYALDRIDVKIA